MVKDSYGFLKFVYDRCVFNSNFHVDGNQRDEYSTKTNLQKSMAVFDRVFCCSLGIKKKVNSVT